MSDRTENHVKVKRSSRKITARFFGLTLLCVSLGLIDGFRSYVSAYSNGRFFLDLDVALTWDVSGWLIWILFIPLVLRLCRHYPLDRSNRRSALLIFLPTGLLLAVVRAFFPLFIDVALFDSFDNLRNWLPRNHLFMVTDFVIALVFYALVVTFGQATNYYKQFREEELRASKLEAQLSKAQLNALKMQLHPHFLFNALNSISALQSENAEAAQEMTARLGDFLRMTLENVGAHEVTLEREIEFTRCYLEIEKVRFGRRLETNIEIAPEVLGCRVPNLILQPLIENAIRHGLAKQNTPGRIRIRAVRENDLLVLEVADNGKGIENENMDAVLTGGLGLSNTKSRLERFYAGNFRFNLQKSNEGGLLITLRLPHEQIRNEETLN